MPFPTMDDKKCKVRKALGQFKWADIEEVQGTQTVLNKNQILQMVTEAKGASLVQPYVKVGLVKTNLVFRIKHKSGHFTTDAIKDDLIVIKAYQETDHTVGGKSVLKKGKAKLAVTSAWWDAVRGDYAGSNLQGALTGYEKAAKALDTTESSTNYQLALNALKMVERAAKDEQSGLGSEDDKTLLQNFGFEVSKGAEAIERASGVYEGRLTKANRDAENLVRVNTVGKIESALDSLQDSLQKQDLFLARVNFIKAATNLRQGLSGTGLKNIQSTLKDLAAQNKVALEDMDGKGISSRLTVLAKSAYTRKQNEMDTLDQQMDNLAQQLGDLTEAPPNGNGDYETKLRATTAGYQEMLRITNECVTKANKWLTIVTKLTPKAANSGSMREFLNGVQKVCTSFDELKSTSFEATQRARNTSAPLNQLKKANGIQPADDKKFLTPKMNAAFNNGQRLSMIRNKAMALLEEAIEGALAKDKTNTDLSGALTLVQDGMET